MVVKGLLLLGLCMLVAGCLNETQQEQPESSSDIQVAPADGPSQHTRPQGLQAGMDTQGGTGRRGFPQEMVNACAGKSGNDTCQFKMDETTVNGVCISRRGGNLSCLPDNMGQGRFSRNISQQRPMRERVQNQGD